MALTDEQLIADLVETFPGVYARPAREYGRPEYQEGVWIGGEAVMPDGLPMFCSFACPDPDEYNGDVHVALERWLENRGYWVETWDAGVYFALPATRRLL